jgi:hypothetical protein
MLIKSLSALSPPLHHLVFLLLHFLFSNHKCRDCLNVNCVSNQFLIPFSHSATKITASFEIDSLIGLLTNYALINSYLFFGSHFFFSLLILSLSQYCLKFVLIIDAQAEKHP